MTDRDALMKAIRDNSEDDTPKLVFADYLQENGDERRAVFLRACVELGRVPEEPDACTTCVSLGGSTPKSHRSRCAWGKWHDKYKQRHDELTGIVVGQRGREWDVAWLREDLRVPYLQVGTLSGTGPHLHTKNKFTLKVDARFGFVTGAEGPLLSLLAAAPHLFAHPVTKVTATDTSPRRERASDSDGSSDGSRPSFDWWVADISKVGILSRGNIPKPLLDIMDGGRSRVFYNREWREFNTLERAAEALELALLKYCRKVRDEYERGVYKAPKWAIKLLQP